MKGMPPGVEEHLTDSFLEKYNEKILFRSVSVLGGGCINNAAKLVTNLGNFFLKWNGNGPADLFIREAESLTEMQKKANEFLLFPTPILSKPIDATPGYLLTNYLENGVANDDYERLGRGLAMLHKINAEKFGFYHDNYCGATLQDNSWKTDWNTFYAENRIGHLLYLIKKHRSWDGADSVLSDKFLAKLPHILPHHPTPSLLHGDLWSGNYLLTSHGPALIDPASSYCDREFEMGIMTLFGGFPQQVFDAYNEVYPLPDEWKDRNPAYQLYHVLNHYLLFGGYYKNQAVEIMKHYL